MHPKRMTFQLLTCSQNVLSLVKFNCPHHHLPVPSLLKSITEEAMCYDSSQTLYGTFIFHDLFMISLWCHHFIIIITAPLCPTMMSLWPHSSTVTHLWCHPTPIVLLVYIQLGKFPSLVLLKYTWVLAKAFEPLSSSRKYPFTRHLFITSSLRHYKSSLILCQTWYLLSLNRVFVSLSGRENPQSL